MKAAVVLTVLLALLAGTARAAERSFNTIKLVSVTTKAAADTNRAPGEPANETTVSSVREYDRLYNAERRFGKPAKAQVGTDRALLVRFASGRAWSTVVATLPGGTIRSMGYMRNVAGEAELQVVDGTGRYANVTGWLSIRDVGTSVFAANIYTLRMP